MTNLQEHKQVIISHGLDNFAIDKISGDLMSCEDITCCDCRFGNADCNEGRVEWLVEDCSDEQASDKSNYDHYEKEIRKIGFESFGINSDGTIEECKHMDCEDCLFDDDAGVNCNEIKINWLDDFYKPVYEYSKEEQTLLKILRNGVIHKSKTGAIYYVNGYGTETKIPNCWDGLHFDNLKPDDGFLEVAKELKRIGES